MLPAAQRAPHASLLTVIGTSLLSAVFVFAVIAVSSPGDVLGATLSKVSTCSANLRTSTSVSAHVRAVIKTGTKISVAATKAGGSWRTTCAGKHVSGRFWYRISAVNGRSVRSLYGVTYLYAASSLFKTPTAIPVTKYAACGAYLRTGPATSSASKTLLKIDAKVLIATSVGGAAWSTTCAGKAVAGSSWYRISRVNADTVQSLYGVPYLYAAAGLFKASATPATPAPTPTPTVGPETAPTPTPTASPGATPTPTPTPTPVPPAFANMTEGIDISHWQGTISWPAVAAAGKKFAFMKASESTDYTDPTYVTNRQQARSAGLYVGAYHFAQPSTELGDAIAEADHFLATATPASGDLLPVLDLERSGSLSQVALTAWVQAYVGRIYERLGVHAIIYCSPNFWKNYMGDTTWFAANGYDILWVAHWTAAVTPLVPGGNWGGDGWTFWQYTSDGAVPGISGRVDLDRYRSKTLTSALIP